MSRRLEQLRHGFQGNADALILMAQELSKTLLPEQDPGEGNERLLRHYVSMGVVDKPLREGRDARYGFRHLVQFLAARRLLAEGFSLAKIAKYTAVVPTDALTAYLERSDRASEAELLVAAFRAEVPADRVPAGRAAAPVPSTRRSAPSRPLPSVTTGMGMVDVMHEMREMEQRVLGKVEDLLRQKSPTDPMLRAFLDELQNQLQQFFRHVAARLEEGLEMQKRFLRDISARLDSLESAMPPKPVATDEDSQDPSVLPPSTPSKQ